MIILGFIDQNYKATKHNIDRHGATYVICSDCSSLHLFFLLFLLVNLYQKGHSIFIATL